MSQKVICPSCGSETVDMKTVLLSANRETRIDVETGQATIAPFRLPRLDPSVCIEWVCSRGHAFDLLVTSYNGTVTISTRIAAAER